jgi:hypothetical protein
MPTRGERKKAVKGYAPGPVAADGRKTVVGPDGQLYYAPAASALTASASRKLATSPRAGGLMPKRGARLGSAAGPGMSRRPLPTPSTGPRSLAKPNPIMIPEATAEQRDRAQRRAVRELAAKEFKGKRGTNWHMAGGRLVEGPRRNRKLKRLEEQKVRTKK